jgi:hypothetical protein
VCVTGYSQRRGLYCAYWYAFRYEFLLYIGVLTMLISKYLRALHYTVSKAMACVCVCNWVLSEEGALLYFAREGGGGDPTRFHFLSHKKKNSDIPLRQTGIGCTVR